MPRCAATFTDRFSLQKAAHTRIGRSEGIGPLIPAQDVLGLQAAWFSNRMGTAMHSSPVVVFLGCARPINAPVEAGAQQRLSVTDRGRVLCGDEVTKFLSCRKVHPWNSAQNE